MSEFGGIFDYDLSTMVFEYLNLAFFAAYGLSVVWLVARPVPGARGLPLKAA
jgi:hypothetical protein